MLKHFYLTLLASLSAALCLGQQNTSFRQGAIVSPQLNPDNSVTFRVRAPKAREVAIVGDWRDDYGRCLMTENKDGIWEYTTPSLPSEMYTYRVMIDGIMGLDPSNPFCKRDVGNLFSVFFVSGGPGDYYQVRDVPHGEVNSVWYHSETVGADRRMTIYLPPQYQSEKKRAFPVFYLLHGSGGDESAWTELGNVPRILDNLIAEGKAEPMIVVMPNGNMSKQAAPGETSENHAYRPVMSNLIKGNYKNGVYESSFDEIIGYVDSHYRTIRKKSARAIAGLSMGGFHTLHTALLHPDSFDYIGLFSAGLGTQYDESAEVYKDYDGQLKALKASGYKLFWIGIGDADGLVKGSKELCAKMDRLGMPYEFNLTKRGHIWANWRQYLLTLAPRLFK